MMSFKSFVITLLLALSTGLAFAGPVNINTANAETLALEIKGIGEKRAQAIIQYREAHGPFKSVDDLTNIKGIGVKLVEMNRDNMTVRKSSK
jgi:competence protein ComEA